MRLREHTAAACLFILIICATASVVAAQEFMQPPIVPPPPGTPSLLCGRFYVQAGMKYRSLESLKFNFAGGQTQFNAIPGTVPFGPTTAGNFGEGTGKDGFLGDPAAIVTWSYNNGQITSTVDPGGAAPVAADPCFGVAGALHAEIPSACSSTDPVTGVTTTLFNNCDAFWGFTTALPDLGRYRMQGVNRCDGTTITVAESNGSFTISDPTVQVDNAGSIDNTHTVTYQVQVPDSLGFLVNVTTVENREIGPQVWSPVFEAGFQLFDFFDLFYGFSWFNVGNSTGISHVLPGAGGRVLIQDTFPFFADQQPDSGWPVGSFQSSNTIIGSAPAETNYQLSTNGPLRGIFPNRQFLTQQDATIPSENIQESINTRADINVYEFRAGSRTWLPLFGLGRMGAIMGGTFMPAYYKITGNRNYVSLGPNVPGLTLLSQSAEIKDWRPHYGAFLGGDLELGWGSVYVNGSIDYTWVNSQSYTMFNVIETSFNPGGMTAAITGGFHF